MSSLSQPLDIILFDWSPVRSLLYARRLRSFGYGVREVGRIDDFFAAAPQTRLGVVSLPCITQDRSRCLTILRQGLKGVAVWILDDRPFTESEFAGLSLAGHTVRQGAPLVHFLESVRQVLHK